MRMERQDMRTKQEYLLSLPFEYIIAFSKETGLIRRHTYYTKKDFVQRLLRSLTTSECKQLYKSYNKGISQREVSTCFLRKYPTGMLVCRAFVRYLRKTTKNVGRLLFEFPIPRTRVDILRLNGFSHAFEVKSQRDRIDRLSYQLPALRKIFEKVALVYPSNLGNKVKDRVGENIGLYLFSNKNGEISIEIERESVETDDYDPVTQLGLLRVEELRTICVNLCGETRILRIKQEMIDFVLRNAERHEINKIFIKTIKDRFITQTRTPYLVHLGVS